MPQHWAGCGGHATVWHLSPGDSQDASLGTLTSSGRTSWSYRVCVNLTMCIFSFITEQQKRLSSLSGRCQIFLNTLTPLMYEQHSLMISSDVLGTLFLGRKDGESRHRPASSLQPVGRTRHPTPVTPTCTRALGSCDQCLDG